MNSFHAHAQSEGEMFVCDEVTVAPTAADTFIPVCAPHCLDVGEQRSQQRALYQLQNLVSLFDGSSMFRLEDTVGRMREEMVVLCQRRSPYLDDVTTFPRDGGGVGCGGMCNE